MKKPALELSPLQKDILNEFKKFQKLVVEECRAGAITKEQAVIKIMVRAQRVIEMCKLPSNFDPISGNLYQARVTN